MEVHDEKSNGQRHVENRESGLHDRLADGVHFGQQYLLFLGISAGCAGGAVKK